MQDNIYYNYEVLYFISIDVPNSSKIICIDRHPCCNINDNEICIVPTIIYRDSNIKCTLFNSPKGSIIYKRFLNVIIENSFSQYTLAYHSYCLLILEYCSIICYPNIHANKYLVLINKLVSI